MASAESIPNGLFCVYWSFCNIAARKMSFAILWHADSFMWLYHGKHCYIVASYIEIYCSQVSSLKVIVNIFILSLLGAE